MVGASRGAHFLHYGPARDHDEAPPLEGVHCHALPGARRAGDRSGPSLTKVGLDLRMVGALRALLTRLRVESKREPCVVAHGVEASWVARAANAQRRVYFAHTRFDLELPSYAPGYADRVGEGAHAGLGAALRGALGMAGELLDLGALSDPMAAISPLLAAQLSARLDRVDRPVRYIPTPWQVPSRTTPAERGQARRELGLGADEGVVLYAGNLDAYQGWEPAFEGVWRDPRRTLLLATESAADVLPAGGRARTRVVPLAGEAQRRRVHAAADVALVPRRVAGGLPIKLLDALSRGVPVLATPLALAGLDPAGTYVAPLEASAIARSLGRLLTRRVGAHELSRVGSRARAWVLEHHSLVAYRRAFDLLLRAATESA